MQFPLLTVSGIMGTVKNWQSSGNHRYYIEEDIIYWESHGLFDLSNGQCVHAVQNNVRAVFGYVLIVVDASDGGVVSPEARKWMAHEAARNKGSLGASAVFGASLLVRAAVNLLLSATRFFAPDSSPIQFVKSEAEAWSYIQEQRHVCRARLGLPPLPN